MPDKKRQKPKPYTYAYYQETIDHFERQRPGSATREAQEQAIEILERIDARLAAIEKRLSES